LSLCYYKYIKAIYEKLKIKFTATTAIPVVFVVAASVFNAFFFDKFYQSSGETGGPALIYDWQEISESAIENLPIAETDEEAAIFIAVEEAAVFNAASPLGNLLPTRGELLVYKVKAGDTLSAIAANFGISLNTILWANSGLKASLIRPGQEIVILPVSGVIHQVQEGETLDSIAALYNVEIDQIRKFNKNLFAPTLIIPGAKQKRIAAIASLSGLPSYPGYYIIPTTGWNWGRLHPANAVDIANACGTPIYAAAEGLVIEEKSYGWNEGYGYYIEINHPNNTVTRYSHTSKNAVSVGDYVLQGDLIAYIGNTGNTHGPTGCHLHFEVRGAKNPFVK
jgi:murein DD-endopeptidase MepM/ murein hydrolase activator NlpD